MCTNFYLSISFRDVIIVIKMVEVKIQKKPCHKGKYFNYMITLPTSLVESMPKFKNAKKVRIEIEKGNMVLKPTK